MKKNLLFLIIISYQVSFAQRTKPSPFSIDKGIVLIGGSIGAYNSKAKYTDNTNNEQKSNGFNFTPAIGWGVKKNTIVGVFLEYINGTSKSFLNDIAIGTNKSSNYGGGLFMRNYKNLGSNFYLLAQTNLGISFGKATTENVNGSTTNGTKQEYKTARISFTPGIAYAINQSFQLELLLGSMLSGSYTSSTSSSTTNPNNTKSNAFDFTVNTAPLLNLAVGFRLFLQAKK
jgi:hypothetical protein